MNEVTSILSAAVQGDARAAESLLPLIYAERSMDRASVVALKIG